MVEKRPDELLLGELTDQLDRTRRLLTQSPDAVARDALERAADDDGEAERRIAARLADRRPVAHPEAFAEAHRLVVHGIEVLDAEGSRDPEIRGFWLATPAVRFLVRFVAEYLVASYARTVVTRLHQLYLRREAKSEPGTAERRLLAAARVEAGRLTTTYSGRGRAGLFLLAGGALIPALASGFNLFGSIPLSGAFLFVVLVSAVPVSFLGSFVTIRGAALAHRRSRLILSGPLAALWEAVGNAGEPPRDRSELFAAVGVGLTALFWLALPAAVLVGILVYG